MYRRLLLIVSLALLTTACVPYYGGGHSYYRSDVYVDRDYYPGYYRQGYPYNRGYYVVPQQPRYYAPAPRYYQPGPQHYYRPPPAPVYRPNPGHGQFDSRYQHGGGGRDWNRGPDRGRGDWDRGRGRGGDRDGNWHR